MCKKIGQVLTRWTGSIPMVGLLVTLLSFPNLRAAQSGDCDHGTTMICTNADGLNSVSDESALEVTSLFIETCYTGDYRLRTGSLARLSNLQKMYLVHARYCETVTNYTVEAGAFGNVSLVNSIEMSQSEITSIPDREFCHLHGLQNLDLHENRIEDMAHVGFGNPTEQGFECNLTSLEFINLNDNRIRKLPNDSFLLSLPNITQLWMRSNRLTEIGSKALTTNHNLESLDLSNNSLTDVAPGTFQNQAALKKLLLSDNNLTALSSQAFHGLRQLTALRLQNNRIHHLDADVFFELENLDSLDLAHNLVDTIPTGLFRSLRLLKYLYLKENRLGHLEQDSFAGLVELVYLNLDNNPIAAVHTGTFYSVPNLMILSFMNSLMLSVPRLPLRSLEELYLTGGRIESVSWNTLQLANGIRILHLDKNRIEAIDYFAFYNLTRLTDLNLASNGLRTVMNGTFATLESLVTLRLEHNRLDFEENIYLTPFLREEGPTANMNIFWTLKSLVHLNLSHNALTRFRYLWLPEKVEYLNLSHNAISNLSSDGVDNSLALKSIDLSHNRIKELICGRENTFPCMKVNFPRSIERIVLHDNVLTYIQANVFESNVNLRQLMINNNRLRHLQLDNPQFNPDINIVKLTLARNPWLCDCNLVWLKQLIKGHMTYSLYYVQDSVLLQCELLYHKNRQRYTSLVSADAGEDFMCTFTTDNWDDNDTRFCVFYDSRHSPDGLRVCKRECPESCTCYREEHYRVVNVDCTARNLTHIDSKLHPGTMSLFLDYNNIKTIEVGDLDGPFVALYNVYLNNNGLETIEDGAFRMLDTVRHLFLQSNRLQDLPAELFVNMTDLMTLDLSHNLLSNVSDRLFQPLVRLERLMLNNNLLHSYPVWNFVVHQLPELEAIALYDNPWSCDCDYVAAFTGWMQNYAQKLSNADNLDCTTESGETLSFITFNQTMCYGSTTILQAGAAAIWATSLVLVIVVVAVSTLVFIYRLEMQVLIYSRYGVRLFHDVNDDDDAERAKAFDAFVSYSSLDETFIVNDFLPGLERIDNPYSVCLHHRDFPLGAFINESIFEAVDKSRRTILILSDNFVRSDWCRFEFRTAHAQMLQDRRNRVIVVILDNVPKDLDPEMKLYLKTNTYVCWKDRLFWKKLYFAMPQRRRNVPLALDEDGGFEEHDL